MQILAALLLACLHVHFANAAHIDPNQDLNALPNNALFTRWRPKFHFLAPAGWQNDPCSALYDAKKNIYHLFYQFHPNHVDWGNISWGHATSRDLVFWTDVAGWQNGEPEAIVTGADGTYDHLGVFSGTGQAVNLKGKEDGNLTIFYTSVEHLPTAWNRDYIPGTESQSLATSADGGKTWSKYEANPVLVTPPGDWDITAWRDPYFHAWAEMDDVLRQETPHYYAVFGSGIKGVGPRIPLYSAPASDLTKWTFLGALFELGRNVSFGGDVTKTGTFGFNFEVPGAFSLVESKEDGGDGKSVHFFITTGTEGGDVSFHPNSHWSVWAEGNMSRRANGSAQFDIISSGVGDWGNLYAITSFWDGKKNRRVSWGWAPEDMNNYGIKAQGFQGSMGLPRELFVHKAHNIRPPSPGIPDASSATWNADTNSTYTVTTLGIKPLPEVVQGLRASQLPSINGQNFTTTVRLTGNQGMSVAGDHFELLARLSNVTGSAGFIIRASPSLEEYTVISYSSTTNVISVNRNKSSLIKQFATYSANGYFEPYILKNNQTEPFDIHIFCDGSLIEVFVNDRFALTTRVYPSRDDALGIWTYVGEGSVARIQGVKVWTNMENVWKGRPTNSSSILVTDDPVDTGNGSWWSGI